MTNPIRFVLWLMISVSLLAAYLAFVTAAKAADKTAQPRIPCGPMKQGFENLEKFGEHRVWSGIVGENPDGQIVQMLFLSNKGTWTLLRCQKDMCCLEGMGVNGGVFT